MSSVEILIAGDHEPFRRSLRSLIESREGWIVSGEAADGKEAVEKAKALRPDVILLDVSMPEIDGLDAVRLIREEKPDSEILIVSQNDPWLMEQAASGVGASGFLHKSRISHDLFTAVEALVKHKGGANRGKDETSQTSATERYHFFDRGGEICRGATVIEDNQPLGAELFAAIVDSSDDAIVSKNLDGVITSWNKSAERIFGYSAQEAIGQHITLIIPRDRWNEEEGILSRLRRGERIDHFETVRKRKDGNTIDLSLTISPVKNARGQVVGASKVARDITERKLAEERERKITAEAVTANAKFRAVFEQTTVFAGIMTKEGVLIEANKLCLDACGYRAEEVLGQPFWETAWWRNFQESRDKIRTATPLAAQGIPYREILDYSWADGTQRLVDFALYPILDNDGQVLFLHPTGVDITDLKRAEENYRSLAERLELEVRARTRELENRNAEVLRQSKQLRELSRRLLQIQDEERRHIARELHDSAGQTLAVLGINLSQLAEQAHKVAPELARQVEANQDVVRQLHEEIRTTSYLLHPPLLDEIGLPAALSWYIDGLMERSALDINLSMDDEFGRLPRDLELVVFRLIQECLTNIHRHSGSKTAFIAIRREGDNISVEVQDEGKGISAEKLAEIQTRGSGVGIRGMRERVEQFQGTLTIESNGVGTRLSASIPIPKDFSQEKASPDHSLRACS
jgi:PAS domain S-box-containing protein